MCSDSVATKRAEDTEEEELIADPQSAVGETGETMPHPPVVPVSDDVVANPELESDECATWNTAHKKYQEFQQSCADILDPGE